MCCRRWASDEEATTEIATTPSASALSRSVLSPSATPAGQAMAVTRCRPNHRDFGRGHRVPDHGGMGLG
ncbi:hypothetical protein OAE23_00825 [Synechococcus sp. AH-551-E11]|nr:hypothetical protein [Synechococcus sp. AH-551-E11]MDB4616627.1 hypothetical protein [Synechococcus sp. AH-551-E11]